MSGREPRGSELAVGADPQEICRRLAEGPSSKREME